MRFTNDAGLGQVLKYSSQRLTRILTVPVTNAYRKLRRLLNPNGFTTRVMADVRKGSKELISGKPQSLKDYFALGNYYIAKKLVFLCALLILVLPVLYLKFLHPVIRSNFLTVPMVVNSLETAGYTGKVALLSTPGGSALYRGPLEEGRITGEGKLYDYQGRLVYEGGFLMEQYQGAGQTFWPNGNRQYTGAFLANAYEGRGTLHREDGTLLYDGNFVAGRYEGSGTLYAPDGALLYEGSFVAGQYEGEGALYEGGGLLYRGGFKQGLMEGPGKLYAGALVIYEGDFAAGTFSGAGREYDPVAGRLLYDGGYVGGKYEGTGKHFDADTGSLVYEGGFYQGAYEGSGKLFDPATQLPRYEGGFRAGRYDGEGVEYDATLGVPTYRGAFLMGVYHGAGTQYDPATGFVVAAGEYRDGQLVVIDTQSLVIGEGTAPEPPPVAQPEGEQDTPPTETTAPTEKPVEKPPAEKPKPTAPVTPPPTGEGAKVYQGPTTPAGGVDYKALAAMPAEKAKGQFAAPPSAWDFSDEKVMVYTDPTEHLGLSLRSNSAGKIVSVDVWNDAPVSGAKTGMTQAALTAALGAPKSKTQEPIGVGRMISISQSNHFFGRLTNLSPDSKVTVLTYQTKTEQIRAIFSGSVDQCLLLEIVP